MEISTCNCNFFRLFFSAGFGLARKGGKGGGGCEPILEKRDQWF